MSKTLAIVRRELIAYFSAPLAYIVLTVFLFMQGFIFSAILNAMNQPGAFELTPLGAFFGGTIFFWLILLITIPLITMRLVAEELRSGTIELLLTAPLTEGQVIAGKALAALVFYCTLWAPTLLYVLIVKRNANIDLLPVASGYLGVLVLGFMFIAVGTFASTLSKNQLIAAIICFALLLVLFSAPLFEMMAPLFLKDAMAHMNLFDQMTSFASGIIDTRHLVYQLSVGVLFLFLATKLLETRKGR